MNAPGGIYGPAAPPVQFGVQSTTSPHSLARRMPRGRFSFLVCLGLCAVAILVVLIGSTWPEEFRRRQAAAPYAFRLVDWEIANLAERAGRIGAGLVGRHAGADPGDQAAIVAYFAASAEQREALEARAEAGIERALTRILDREGLIVRMPLAPDGRIVFPPVSLSFESPPRVLIVSPLDRIAVVQSELLRADMSLGEIEAVEAAVDSLGVSSLVVPIGGLATYPAMVQNTTRPRDALASAAHEWIHAYFFFAPLGRGYWSSQVSREINETAAELAGRELGDRLAQELDLDGPPRSTEAAPASPPPIGRDFRTIMRTTRVEVDRLLAVGRIEEASAYMRDRQVELAAAGYDVRKLNQAYFAFHGSYGDAAAGHSPIPARLRRLREASPSLGSFLRDVAQITTSDALARAVGER